MLKVSYQVDQSVPHERVEKMFCEDKLLTSWPWFKVDHIERVWEGRESTTYVRGHVKSILDWFRIVAGLDTPWAMCTVGW